MTLTLKKDVQKHVVTSGNYGMAAAGQPLFVCVGSGASSRIVYNVVPGQLVAYTINTDGTTTTVDAGTLAASDIYSLYVGVGVDTDGDGVTNDIRHIGIEQISGCHPREASASSPKCGSPKVVDFYFDCTQCDETYSVMVKVDDNQTRSYSPWNKSFAEFVGSIVTECSSCSNCPPEHNCREVACKLADALNSELDLAVGTRNYPDWKGKGLPRPYFATRLHENSFKYCISPQSLAGSCENCTHVGAISSAFIDGVQYDFVGNVDPNNPTLTFRAQIDSIIAQINDAFKTAYGDKAHGGSAYATGGYSNCCDVEIWVNSCDAAFELRDETDTEITPTVSENPFTVHSTYTPEPDCIDCDEQPASSSFNCGIRVIAEQIKPDCGCLIDQPLMFYGRNIEVLPFGDGWKGKTWRVVEVQSMELPAGFGSWIQWLEYQNEPDGRGRQYSRSNINKGWANLPGNKARINNAVTARCDVDYCSYYYKLFMEKSKLDNQPGVLTVHSNVHIPSNDGATIAAWESFSDALLGLNPQCKVIGNVACTTGENLVVE